MARTHAGMAPEARDALLHGFACAIATLRAYPEAYGQEATRLLRLAGTTWTILFRDTQPAEPHKGDFTPSRARIVSWIAFATPAQLTELAVILLEPLPAGMTSRYDDRARYNRMHALLRDIHQVVLCEQSAAPDAALGVIA